MRAGDHQRPKIHLVKHGQNKTIQNLNVISAKDPICNKLEGLFAIAIDNKSGLAIWNFKLVHVYVSFGSCLNRMKIHQCYGMTKLKYIWRYKYTYLITLKIETIIESKWNGLNVNVTWYLKLFDELMSNGLF